MSVWDRLAPLHLLLRASDDQRRRGAVDGTQRREEATDDEEEEEDNTGDHEGAGTPSAAGAHAGSSMPAVATSPRSSLAEPPGFSPVRDGTGALLMPRLHHCLLRCCDIAFPACAGKLKVFSI